MLRKNKKGSLTDLIVIGAVLLAIAVSVLLGYRLMDGINDQVGGMAGMPAEATTSATTLTGYFPTVIDISFMLLAIGLGLVTLVLAAMVRVHPVFIPLFIIGLIILLILCGVFSNIYQEMADNEELIEYSDDLTFISHFLTYLPLIVFVFGILLMIVMYKTWSSRI